MSSRATVSGWYANPAWLVSRVSTSNRLPGVAGHRGQGLVGLQGVEEGEEFLLAAVRHQGGVQAPELVPARAPVVRSPHSEFLHVADVQVAELGQQAPGELGLGHVLDGVAQAGAGPCGDVHDPVEQIRYLVGDHAHAGAAEAGADQYDRPVLAHPLDHGPHGGGIVLEGDRRECGRFLREQSTTNCDRSRAPSAPSGPALIAAAVSVRYRLARKWLAASLVALVSGQFLLSVAATEFQLGQYLRLTAAGLSALFAILAALECHRAWTLAAADRG
ncbi:hypothetical protein [Nocardia sp. CC227C]|uniref:hypothetical protein n=1 Tax=Nocardia sp. CC227C TaxID=3044562 RepID=UPI00278C3C10|nr:hypothetical protein [Nocardia sp. CC227C]